ncbi:MAG: type II secretion system GspH family protein [Lachnospiraceae bacterium]|nr:type II secretion system GspH family protein [Lachnospiraceae bacterium]
MKVIRRNNKGFSLVELIVVVLIMAIVAVALAPQVVKWVENSRISSDLETRTSIEKACQLAVTNEEVFEEVKTGDHQILITKDDSGTHVQALPDESGKLWDKVARIYGVDTWEEFKNSIELKSTPVNAPRIELRVYVYVDGHTFSTLSGFASTDIKGS